MGAARRTHSDRDHRPPLTGELRSTTHVLRTGGGYQFFYSFRPIFSHVYVKGVQE
jgi:hypothetical protein